MKQKCADVGPLVLVACVKFRPLGSSNRAHRPPCFAVPVELGTHCVGLAVKRDFIESVKMRKLFFFLNIFK